MPTHPHPGLQDQHQHGEVAASTRPGQRHLPELAWILPAVPARISRINTRPRSGLNRAPMPPKPARSTPAPRSGHIDQPGTAPPPRAALIPPGAPIRNDQDQHPYAEVAASTGPGRHHFPELAWILPTGAHTTAASSAPVCREAARTPRQQDRQPVRRSGCMDRPGTAPPPRAGVDLRERGTGTGATEGIYYRG